MSGDDSHLDESGMRIAPSFSVSSQTVPFGITSMVCTLKALPPLRQQVLVRKSLSSGRNDGHDYHKSVATKNHNGLHRYGLRDYWSD